MSTAVVTIIWILLGLIAGLSMLLLYAVFGVSSSIQKQVAEQKITNKLLHELSHHTCNGERKISMRQ